MNPAFYFEKVTYRQKTTITESFDPEGGELENARFLYSKLTEMGYKLEGIAAMLGNFLLNQGLILNELKVIICRLQLVRLQLVGMILFGLRLVVCRSMDVIRISFTGG